MIQFLNANPTNIAMTRPRWPVDIASHAKFDSINFNTFRHYVAYLNVTSNMLVFWYSQITLICLIFLILILKKCTIF